MTHLLSHFVLFAKPLTADNAYQRSADHNVFIQI